MLPQVHQVGQPVGGDLQACGQQGSVSAVGHAQEQAGHELRDHGQGSQVDKKGINVKVEKIKLYKIEILMKNEK